VCSSDLIWRIIVDEKRGMLGSHFAGDQE
jgi:hypothetical protein